MTPEQTDELAESLAYLSQMPRERAALMYDLLAETLAENPECVCPDNLVLLSVFHDAAGIRGH